MYVIESRQGEETQGPDLETVATSQQKVTDIEAEKDRVKSMIGLTVHLYIASIGVV